jgi:hypothetical protein
MKVLELFFNEILNPGVKILFGLAVVYFLWGIFKYIKDGDSDVAKTDGKNHVLWSTVGLFIMSSVWGIMHFLQNSVNTLSGK